MMTHLGQDVAQTQETAKLALMRWGLNGDLRLITKRTGKFVFECHSTVSDSEKISYLTHEYRGTYERLAAELDWIRYLQSHGIAVARPVRSLENNWIESVWDGPTKAHVTVFEKENGSHLKHQQVFNQDFAARFGKFIGSLHLASTRYEPNQNLFMTPTITDRQHLKDAALYIPQSRSADLRRIEDLKAQVGGLPRRSDNYGHIHGDLHWGNFVVCDKGIITLFDFEDSCRGHFAYDLAVPLCEMRWGYQDGFLRSTAKEVTEWEKTLIDSYLDAYSGGSAFIDEVPLFCELRSFELFAWAHMLNRPRSTGWIGTLGF